MPKQKNQHTSDRYENQFGNEDWSFQTRFEIVIKFSNYDWNQHIMFPKKIFLKIYNLCEKSDSKSMKFIICSNVLLPKLNFWIDFDWNLLFTQKSKRIINNFWYKSLISPDFCKVKEDFFLYDLIKGYFLAQKELISIFKLVLQ